MVKPCKGAGVNFLQEASLLFLFSHGPENSSIFYSFIEQRKGLIILFKKVCFYVSPVPCMNIEVTVV